MPRMGDEGRAPMLPWQIEVKSAEGHRGHAHRGSRRARGARRSDRAVAVGVTTDRSMRSCMRRPFRVAATHRRSTTTASPNRAARR